MGCKGPLPDWCLTRLHSTCSTSKGKQGCGAGWAGLSKGQEQYTRKLRPTRCLSLPLQTGGPGHVASENSVHCFAPVSGLNNTFPWNGVKQCATCFGVHCLSFGGCQKCHSVSRNVYINPIILKCSAHNGANSSLLQMQDKNTKLKNKLITSLNQFHQALKILWQ